MGSRSKTPSGTSSPTVARRRRQPETTAVFESYWRFAAERQAIFFRRLAGTTAPWTEDPVLREFKFTNAYRASDRTSQFLIRQVIYEGDQAPREVFFRTLLFKLFNRVETWQAISVALESLSSRDFDVVSCMRVLDGIRASGRPLYSAAYIMPPVRSSLSQSKHVGHLELLRVMLDEALPERIFDAKSLRGVYDRLLAYPSLGPFLAFQYAIDLNYGRGLSFDEDDFVVAGPGAAEGLDKCFTNRDDWSDEDLIAWTIDRQEVEFASRGIAFRDLFGRRLKPIDAQNLYCEIGKYARVAHPGFTKPGGRSRIKQRFSPQVAVDSVWYPPKWGLDVAPRRAITGRSAEVASGSSISPFTEPDRRS
ncbi:MAG: hypothetical protein QOH61_1440 [Chloroflexota bacterium]|nr:hypothetical protein [Chloroflexota bacterium]